MRQLSDADLAQILDCEPFRMIGSVADEQGVECYVVGGYVRDLFLERPSQDIDVVVVGSGIAVAEALKRRLGRKAHLSVFRNFGTAQVKCGNQEIEFVISKDSNIIPVEVKSKNGKTESLNCYIESFNPKLTYKFVDGNAGRVDNKITLPHYMAMKL